MNVIDPKTRADRRKTSAQIVSLLREHGEDSGHISGVLRWIITHSVHYGDRCDVGWTGVVEELENLRYVILLQYRDRRRFPFQQGLYFKKIRGHRLRFSVVTGDRVILKGALPI